jgi:hypothetical protein
MRGGKTVRGQTFLESTTNARRILKVGTDSGLDVPKLQSICSTGSAALVCAPDIDSFLLIGDLSYISDNTCFDVLHIAGASSPESDQILDPVLHTRSAFSTRQQLNLAQIKTVLRTTGIMSRLVIFDTPPLAKNHEEYLSFIEEFHIAAIIYYKHCTPRQDRRVDFLPKLLAAVVKGRGFKKAIETAVISDEKNSQLLPELIFNKKLLRLADERLDLVSLDYPF